MIKIKAMKNPNATPDHFNRILNDKSITSMGVKDEARHKLIQYNNR